MTSAKNKKITAVLFDLDGTLIDTAPDFIRIIKKICAEQGVASPADEQIREQVSAGSKAMVSLINTKNADNADDIQAAFREQFLAEYEKNICVDTQLYAGMAEVLAKLEENQIAWGIVTNKPRGLTELLLAALGLTTRCQVLVCPDDVTHAKPHPEPMHLAADTLGVACEQVIYIGDHPRDITAGNAANMTTVLAKYGYLPPVKQADGSLLPMNVQTHQEIMLSWQADYMIDTASDLIPLLWQSGEFVLNENTANIHQAASTQTLSHEQVRQFTAPENCLLGKHILVTGAGSGIGREAAETYARYGATVLLLGRTTSKLEEVYDNIENAGGFQPAIIPMHLESATYADMQKLRELITEEFGQLHGILHNAAELGTLTPLTMCDIDEFERVMRINFHSVFALTQVLLPLLQKSQHSSVLFTTSSVGSKPRALWGAYALSKQGVEGMCDIFTQEHTQDEAGVRFNCINPGGTRTSMRASAYPHEDPSTLKTPADIMAGYVCLMADASKHTKGQVIDLQPK